VPAGSLEGSGPRGVYVSGDQSVSIVINGEDHVSIRARASGLQLRETWARVNAIDDDLSRSLNYAFHERLGYLTASVGKVGTGLEAAVVLHLSGLAMSGDRVNLDEAAAKREVAIGPERCVMDMLYNGFTNCFRAANRSTLGRSEEETLLHLKHLVGELVEWEKETRRRSLSEELPRLEDSVARALGVARSARLMEFDEAAALVSSLRLGAATGLIKDYPLAMLDQLLLDAQPFHVRLRAGRNCDEATLSEERAKLFRARFSQ
jgi:protein arginine kinase